jgi:hypothetical protein
MAFQDMVLKAFVTSISNATQLGWTFKKTWTPQTIAAHPPLITTPN